MMSGYSFESACTARAIKSFREAVEGEAVGNYTKAYETWKRVRNVVECFRKAVSCVDSQPVSVLDLGCGDGYHVLHMCRLLGARRSTVEFKGIDLSQVKVDVARRTAESLGFANVSFAVGDLETVFANGAQYDIILCTDVIEHIQDFKTFIANTYSTLKENGYSIFTTPNMKNSLVSLVHSIRRTPSPDRHDESYCEEGHGHISLNATKEWIRVFEGSGFDVLEVKRGAAFFGGPRYNRHPFLFACLVVFDQILDAIPFARTAAEAHTYFLHKK